MTPDLKHWPPTYDGIGEVAHPATGIAAIDTVTVRDFFDDLDSATKGILRAGEYALDGDVIVRRPVAIEGAGSFPAFLPKSLDAAAQGEFPTGPSRLDGTVLMQTRAGADVLKLAGSNQVVKLKGIGLKFDDAIALTNTGHGINAAPEAQYGGAPDFGIRDSRIEDVQVWGTDGNHYGFRFQNANMSTFTDLRSYGGGLLLVEGESSWYNHGNLVFIHPMGKVMRPGAAHGIHLRAVAGRLNLISMIRPQVNMTTGVGITPSQFLFHAADPTSIGVGLSVFGPDLEDAGIGCPVNFGTSRRFIDPSGYYGSTVGAAELTWLVGALGDAMHADMRPIGGGTGATVTPGGGAGTGATASVTGDEFTGTVILNTGTNPNGALGQVAFTVAFPRAGRAGRLQVWPANLAAAGVGHLQPIATGNPTSGMSVRFSGVTPPASTADLRWFYRVDPN